MGILDSLRGGGAEAAELRETLGHERLNADILRENLRTLETTMMEDEGWRRAGWRSEREFTRAGLDQIILLSRAYYLSNPLIQRAVNVTGFYTFAQGVTHESDNERIQELVIDPLIKDEKNRAELYSHQAQLLTDVDQMVDGNIFLPMFTNAEGDVQIRSIPADEVREIHVRDGDNQSILFYRREWTERTFDLETGNVRDVGRKALYPDWRYFPKRQPESIGGIDVYWDAPVIHQRTGGLKHMQFGVPETYAALDWARAYRRFLENWHSLVASLAKFAWKATTKGSKIKGLRERVESTIDKNDEGREDNEFTPGGMWIGKPGDELTPIPKTGATTSAEDAKPSRLMVASAMNLPDTILSNDPQQGALATAKTLDRPTELYIKSRQTMWADLHKAIHKYKTDTLIRLNKLDGRVYWDTDDNSTVEWTEDFSTTVSYPPILEHDPLATVQAIVAAATLEGKAEAGTVPPETLSKILMEAIGVEDVESAINELDADARAQLDETVEELKRLAEASGVKL